MQRLVRHLRPYPAGVGSVYALSIIALQGGVAPALGQSGGPPPKSTTAAASQGTPGEEIKNFPTGASGGVIRVCTKHGILSAEPTSDPRARCLP